MDITFFNLGFKHLRKAIIIIESVSISLPILNTIIRSTSVFT